jgi:hypothetical protein
MQEIHEMRLARAQTEQEVVGIVRDYVATWLAEDLGRIPRRCMPGKLRDAEAIADCALELTLERIAQADPDSRLVAMEAFFAHACARVSKLEGAALKRVQYARLVLDESQPSSGE